MPHNWPHRYILAVFFAGGLSVHAFAQTSPINNGGSSGFPIIIGSTSIASGSTTTTIANLTLTGGTLTTTTISGLTVSTTTGTLTIANGKTATFSNTLTLAGTDGSTLNVGAGGTLGTAAFVNTGTSGGTVPLLNAANTWSGNQTMPAGTSGSNGLLVGTIGFYQGGTNPTAIIRGNVGLGNDLWIASGSWVRWNTTGGPDSTTTDTNLYRSAAGVVGAGANDSNAGGTFLGAGFAMRDTSAAFNVTFGATSSTTLTANRALTVDVANGARTFKLGANLTIVTDPGGITGALKSNGSGTFTQAACSDLSNGASGCSTATGTSGATIPLLNAANVASISAGGNTWEFDNLGTGRAVLLNTAQTDTHEVLAIFNNNLGTEKLAFLANGRLILGAASASVPASKASSTTWAFRLGDDSADAPISSAAAAHSGAVTITGGTVTQAAGTLGLFGGNGSTPTLGANGEGDVFTNTANGLVLIGQGSGQDIEILNKSGSLVMFVPTGTTTAAFNGQIQAQSMTQSSAAQSGTVCQNTGATLTYDATVGCLTSDERLKVGLAYGLPDAVPELMALRPMTYRWADDAPRFHDDPGEHIGMGAFATAYVDERLIARGGDGQPRGWRTDAMIALAVAGFQDHEARLRRLEDTQGKIK